MASLSDANTHASVDQVPLEADDAVFIYAVITHVWACVVASGSSAPPDPFHRDDQSITKHDAILLTTKMIVRWGMTRKALVAALLYFKRAAAVLGGGQVSDASVRGLWMVCTCVAMRFHGGKPEWASKDGEGLGFDDSSRHEITEWCRRFFSEYSVTDEELQAEEAGLTGAGRNGSGSRRAAAARWLKRNLERAKNGLLFCVLSLEPAQPPQDSEWTEWVASRVYL